MIPTLSFGHSVAELKSKFFPISSRDLGWFFLLNSFNNFCANSGESIKEGCSVKGIQSTVYSLF